MLAERIKSPLDSKGLFGGEKRKINRREINSGFQEKKLPLKPHLNSKYVQFKICDVIRVHNDVIIEVINFLLHQNEFVIAPKDSTINYRSNEGSTTDQILPKLEILHFYCFDDVIGPKFVHNNVLNNSQSEY